MNAARVARTPSLAGLDFAEQKASAKTVCLDKSPPRSVTCSLPRPSLSRLERLANTINPYLIPRSRRERVINGMVGGLVGAVAYTVGGLAGAVVVSTYIGLGLVTTLSSSDPFRKL